MGLILSSTIDAQSNVRFILYNSSNGLSQNSVHCIYQDRQGLLWLGTQDGLNSFDGKNFSSYRYNPNDTNSLSDQFILAIQEDKEGFLWIETRSGINRFNKYTGKSQRFYISEKEKNGLPRTASSLLKNINEQIILPNYLQPLYFNNSLIPHYLPKKFHGYKSGLVDVHNTIWSISNTGSLQVVSGDFSKPYQLRTKATIPNFNIVLPYKLIENKYTKSIYIYSSHNNIVQIYHTISNTFSKIILNNNLVVNDILFVNDRVTWFATSNGVFIKEGNNSPILLKNTLLPTGSILSLYKDVQQNIWVGTSSGGFAFYNPSFNHFTLTTVAKTNDAINGYTEANDIKYYAAASGLYYRTNNNNRIVVHPFFANKKISSICTDKTNNIWLSVAGNSIYQLNHKGKIIKQFYGNSESLNTKAVMYLYCSNKNEIIACTQTGFFVYNQSQKKWKSFYRSAKKNNKYGWYTLHGIQLVNKQHWFSNQAGILITDENFNTKAFISSASTNSAIIKTIITGITEDKNGVIWIATLSSGLYKYENNKLTQYSTNKGLVSNVLNGLVADENNNIWCATSAGLEVLDQLKQQFYLINEKDGLPNNAFTLGSIKIKNNEIFIGSAQGLITIQSDKLKLQQPIAKAQISAIKIDGIHINLPNSILKIDPNVKTIGFSFSLQQALQPKHIIYQYKLLGVEENWNILQSTNNEITYTSLPYNKLTLLVRAAYNQTLLSNAPVNSFSFFVRTPVTKTWWFKTGIVLVAIAFVFFLYKRKQKRRRERKLYHQKIQQELKLERERISRDLHDNIGAYTSALISGIGRLNINSKIKEETGDLYDYATNMMGYLRETIWVLNNEKLTLIAFTDRFKNYANRMVKNYENIQLKFNISLPENEQILTPAESLNLFRILQESLQNSCKHANATTITFGYNYNKKHKFWVNDNGKGFEPLTKENQYGLQNMQARCNEIGFQLNIDSNESGTTIWLTENTTFVA